MESPTKSQFTRVEVGSGQWRFYNEPIQQLKPMTLTSRQSTWSINHDISQLGGLDDIGGPFRTEKTWFAHNGQSFYVQGLGREYKGTLHLSGDYIPEANYSPSPAYSSLDDMVAAGTTAIARTIPTNATSGASVFIGELREGLPHILGSSILKTKCRDLRKLGDEHLNVQFGWKPMVADLRKFAKAVKKQNSTLRQLHRDSGRDVRRRFEFPEETSKTAPDGPKWGFVTPTMCNGDHLDAWMMRAEGPEPTGYTYWSEKTRRRWFSGRYTYHVPDHPSGFFGKIDKWDAEANKLLGTRLTPEVVWNLAPWSWAADWFSNAGDVIHNISALQHDNLVMRSGYIMEETSVSNVSNWQGYLNLVGSPNTFTNLVESFGTTTKVRYCATPYGFSLTGLVMNPRQIAITAALGLSRAPRRTSIG